MSWCRVRVWWRCGFGSDEVGVGVVVGVTLVHSVRARAMLNGLAKGPPL